MYRGMNKNAQKIENNKLELMRLSSSFLLFCSIKVESSGIKAVESAPTTVMGKNKRGKVMPKAIPSSLSA